MSLIERDEQVVWHPFTPVKGGGEIIPIVKGEGVWLIDEEGNRYLDAISSWWVNIHGHSNNYIAEKVFEQLKTLEHVIFAGFTHPAAVEVCERIIKLTDCNFSKVFFSDNGSTSVEVALKVALQYWWNKEMPRKKIIALENAYHGDTFGAMSAASRSKFSEPFDQLLFDVIHIDPFKDEEQVIATFKEHCNEDVAAFIYEPLVQGAGGMLMYSVDLLEQFLSIAKKYDVICIADEVMTGFGRTGKTFASQHMNLKPDLMAVSKGITGGTMALGLTLVNDHIFSAFDNDDRMKTFHHGHSYTANPVACSAALASLDLVEQPDFQMNMNRIVEQHASFKRKLESLSGIENIRQQGTILAFDVKDNNSGYFSSIRDELYRAFIDRKLLLRPLGNTIYIMPPMVITNDELSQIYEGILAVLANWSKTVNE